MKFILFSADRPCILASLIITSLLPKVQPHAVEIRRCITPAGNLRLYVEHWHSDLTDHTGVGNTIVEDIDTGSSFTLYPDGIVNNVPRGSLPDCGTPSTETVVSSCTSYSSTGDWVYYDYPLQCNTQHNYNLLGSDQYYYIGDEACNELFPATFSVLRTDSAPPVVVLNGTICTGLEIIQAQTKSCVDKSAVVPITITAGDECDPNPGLQTTYPMGGIFPIGSTTIYSTATDNMGFQSSCSFQVIVTARNTDCWEGAQFSWDITCLNPGTIEKNQFSNEVTLSIPYNVSDQFTNFTVFEKDCLTPADHIIPTRNVEVFPEANGFRKYDLNLEMNQTLIETDSDIWYPYNNVNGTVYFCVRASLWMTDDNNVAVNEVTFLETNYTVFVDKTEGFELTGVDSITVDRVGATDKAGPEIDYDADLTAYQCDENNNYAKLTSPPALVQGDFLLMCVESETVIEIEEILELSLSQPSSTDVTGKYHPTFVFDAIDDGTKKNGLVDTGCTPEGPSRMCWIKIQLIANFFASPDPSDITADGTVTLNVAGSPGARRVLNIRGGSRELGGVAEGHISMSAGLSSASLNTEKGEEASSASSTSRGGAVAAAIIGGATFAIV